MAGSSDHLPVDGPVSLCEHAEHRGAVLGEQRQVADEGGGREAPGPGARAMSARRSTP